MKALSVRQPFANLIASGEKKLELRTWSTLYRGELLIVAATKPHEQFPEAAGPWGVSLAIVDLVDVLPFTQDHERLACIAKPAWRGFSWVLDNPRLVTQSRVRGLPGLFEFDFKQ